MYKILPLFKSHYSLGKSILTLEKPLGPTKSNEYPTRIFDLLINNKLNTLVLVDDNLSGLLQASEISEKNKIKLVFGLRLWVTSDITEKGEECLLKQSKYIIFAKNPTGYKDLIKIWSIAAKEGFYYEPRIDFKVLKKFWNNKHLQLVVPFYDSFLYLNSFESHIHVPEFNFVDNPVFLSENNSLPFDNVLANKVKQFTEKNHFTHLPAQSIYYKSPDDFIAYMAFRCIHNRTTIEKPELSHMGSDEFNFEKWLDNEKD